MPTPTTPTTRSDFLADHIKFIVVPVPVPKPKPRPAGKATA